MYEHAHRHKRFRIVAMLSRYEALDVLPQGWGLG
jgi:hypothetical protein